MIQGSLKALGLVLLAFLLVSPVFGQAADRPQNFESIMLDDFDDPETSQWMVLGSKFINEDAYPLEYQLVEAWPEAVYRRPPEGEELRSLGIRAAFNRQGYNYLEIVPVEEGDDGDMVPRALPLPGRVRNLDMWVWGSNRSYYIEAILRDHRGITHTLHFGEIGFRGWHNIKMDIPTYIPQEVTYVPQRQGLELVKLVLWTRPEERVDQFYVYLDNLKCFTDTFDDPFDGELLADPEYVDQLWGGSE